MKPIITVPNKVLINPSKKVGAVDQKIKKIINQMRLALERADNPKGVGLAAPQIGLNLRIFLMRPEETDPIRVFINPEITMKSKTQLSGIPDTDGHLEGCLSIPRVWGKVNRSKEITLKFINENGEIKSEKFTDFPAIIIQHETDHLNGVLFTKRVIEQKGRLYQPSINDKGEEVLEEIEI